MLFIYPLPYLTFFYVTIISGTLLLLILLLLLLLFLLLLLLLLSFQGPHHYCHYIEIGLISSRKESIISNIYNFYALREIS